MDAKQTTTVDMLLEKAGNATDAVQALNYSQAACNAANALRAVAEAERVIKSIQT